MVSESQPTDSMRRWHAGISCLNTNHAARRADHGWTCMKSRRKPDQRELRLARQVGRQGRLGRQTGGEVTGGPLAPLPAVQHEVLGRSVSWVVWVVCVLGRLCLLRWWPAAGGGLTHVSRAEIRAALVLYPRGECRAPARAAQVRVHDEPTRTHVRQQPEWVAHSLSVYLSASRGLSAYLAICLAQVKDRVCGVRTACVRKPRRAWHNRGHIQGCGPDLRG